MERLLRFLQGCMAPPRVKGSYLSADRTYRKQQKQPRVTEDLPYVIGNCNGTGAVSSDPAVHLTLVLDGSQALQDHALVIIAKGIQLLLRLLQPDDTLTIWLFNQTVLRPICCQAQAFEAQMLQRSAVLQQETRHKPKADTVLLYDAIVEAIEDLESQGARHSVAKPLLVLTGLHQGYGQAEAFEAKNALLWCNIPHMHPILVSCGDQEVFEEVRQTKTREVFVDKSDEVYIRKAFLVAGEHLQAILRETAQEQETDLLQTRDQSD